MKKTFLLILLMSVLALNFGCNKKTADTTQTVISELKIQDDANAEDGVAQDATDENTQGEAVLIEKKDWARANNSLAIKTLQHLKEDGSTAFSTFSIQRAFGMVTDGASAETRDQMRSVLGFDANASNISAMGHALEKEIFETHSDDMELNAANNVYVHNSYKLEEAFTQSLNDNYGVVPKNVDFAAKAEEVRTEINTWVEEQTRERIKDLIPGGALNSQTRMVLVNALYFKAPWSDAFTESLTVKKEFRGAQETTQVDTMHTQKEMMYYEDDTTKALNVTYQNKDYAMLFIMPKEDDGIIALIDSLTVDSLQGYLDNAENARVTLELPKFKLESKVDAKGLLISLGMKLPFDEASANFSGMNPSNDLFISDAFHQAFVQIDEKGTEAAAATAAIMAMRAMPIPREIKDVEFKADHPFLFAIYHAPSKVVLFMGRVDDI